MLLADWDQEPQAESNSTVTAVDVNLMESGKELVITSDKANCPITEYKNEATTVSGTPKDLTSMITMDTTQGTLKFKSFSGVSLTNIVFTFKATTTYLSLAATHLLIMNVIVDKCSNDTLGVDATKAKGTVELFYNAWEQEDTSQPKIPGGNVTTIQANPVSDSYFTIKNTTCPLKKYRISHLELATGKNLTIGDWSTKVSMTDLGLIKIENYTGINTTDFTGLKVMVQSKSDHLASAASPYMVLNAF